MGTNALRLLKQIEDIRLKHLAGEHDQKSHAPSKYGKSQKLTLPADVNWSGAEQIGRTKFVHAGDRIYLALMDKDKVLAQSTAYHFGGGIIDAKGTRTTPYWTLSGSVSSKQGRGYGTEMYMDVLRYIYPLGIRAEFRTSESAKALHKSLQGRQDTELRDGILYYKPPELNAALKQSAYTAPIMSYNEGRERGQIADVYTSPYDGQTIGTWLDKQGVERTEQGMYVFYIAIREDSHGVDRGQELESKPEDVKLDKGERICRLELRPTQIDGNDKAVLREDLRW